MTTLYGEGDGIVGDRVIAYARRIEVMRIPISRTHRHRAKGAKLNNAECYIVKPIRWRQRSQTRGLH